MKLLRIVLLFILIAGAAAADQQLDRFDDLLGEEWFGVYMQDKKIGYASTGLTRDGEAKWSMKSDLEFVFSMNQISQKITSSEKKTYEGPSAELVSSIYENSSNAGIVTVEGQRVGNEYIVTTNIAGQSSEKILSFPVEILDNILQIELLAISGGLKENIVFKSEVYISDPPLTGITDRIKKVIEISRMMINGIETDVFTVRDSIPSLMIGASTILDEFGNHMVLEIPSMAMVMKSEPEAIARQIEHGFDMLNDNIIKAPNGPTNLNQVSRGTYILSGYQIDQLPESDWTDIDKITPDSARITVTIPVNKKYNQIIGANVGEMEEYLKPEQLIQSDDQEIIDLARSIIGDETNAYQATQIINGWVYSNIKKVFSPGISNALQTYHSGLGDCGEHSALTAALLRAAGIPSRIAAGVVYWPEGEGFAYHAWVEAYVGEWIQIEPTLSGKLTGATHIMLTSGGLKDHLIAIMGAFKSINIQIVSFE